MYYDDDDDDDDDDDGDDDEEDDDSNLMNETAIKKALHSTISNGTYLKRFDGASVD